ncbi:coiled-coil domain-containing protein 65-like isoform X2 [Centruroides sculpturatus]|uniref:coiled-coil domain-containing protein 65-like isoform X2 n=1 Tax=Centruroides sculpturatus TaxID=218467 RepID=UPI000C6D663B|nr:coiled-coil domain-containing protein 65-like isoform X2 [Centruroides sculpturatus]
MEEQLRKQLVKQFLEFKIFKENELAHLNEKKLNALLIPLLREKKLKELLKDGELMFQQFQKMLDMKNELCSFFEKEFQVSEMQYIRTISHYYEIFNEIIEIFQHRAQDIYFNLSSQLTFFKEKYEKTYKDINERHNDDIRKINEIKMEEKVNYEENQKCLEDKYEKQINELKKQEIDQKQEIKVAIEPTIEKLWKLIIECYKSYHVSTLEQRTLYENLIEKDKKCIEEIKKNIAKLQQKIKNIKEFQYEELYKQEKENKEIQEYSVKRTKALSKILKNKKQEIKHFVMETDEILKYLNMLIEKAEKIFKIKELYSALEFTDEKIQPYNKLSEECIKEEELDLLENFKRNYNKVLLDCCILNKDIEDLKRKNKELHLNLSSDSVDFQINTCAVKTSCK